jgi:hypothetical protein
MIPAIGNKDLMTNYFIFSDIISQTSIFERKKPL